MEANIDVKNVVFEQGIGQVILPQLYHPTIALSIERTQDQYRAVGEYVPFQNRIEERVAELWVWQYLRTNLPDWDVDPLFLDRSIFDIRLRHKTQPITKFVEVKSKFDEPDYYIGKFTGELDMDMTGTLPFAKLRQVLRADYTVWAMTSMTGICSEYTDTSTVIIGITGKELLCREEFQKKVRNNKPYYFLDPRKAPFLFKGKNSLHELVHYLNSIGQG
ncbi:MAG: hypothetical protein V1725_07820 [archaeon]